MRANGDALGTIAWNVGAHRPDIDSSGAFTIDAKGEVYKLGNPASFAGDYAQGRDRFDLGEGTSAVPDREAYPLA
jgi:hypothetical protein